MDWQFLSIFWSSGQSRKGYAFDFCLSICLFFSVPTVGTELCDKSNILNSEFMYGGIRVHSERLIDV